MPLYNIFILVIKYITWVYSNFLSKLDIVCFPFFQFSKCPGHSRECMNTVMIYLIQVYLIPDPRSHEMAIKGIKVAHYTKTYTLMTLRHKKAIWMLYEIICIDPFVCLS